MKNILDILDISPVIPICTFSTDNVSIPVAKALLNGGIKIIEVTLRTTAGLESIAKIKQEIPEICVGAGTVWKSTEALQVISAGADFIVSPGRSDEVYQVCKEKNIPLLPGAQTISEVGYLVSNGFLAVKFFPAEFAGGTNILKAMNNVFPRLKFCPTGGVSYELLSKYLSLSYVPCVGCSWVVENKDMDMNNWHVIESFAHKIIKTYK